MKASVDKSSEKVSIAGTTAADKTTTPTTTSELKSAKVKPSETKTTSPEVKLKKLNEGEAETASSELKLSEHKENNAPADPSSEMVLTTDKERPGDVARDLENPVVATAVKEDVDEETGLADDGSKMPIAEAEEALSKRCIIIAFLAVTVVSIILVLSLTLALIDRDDDNVVPGESRSPTLSPTPTPTVTPTAAWPAFNSSEELQAAVQEYLVGNSTAEEKYGRIENWDVR